VRRGWQYRSRRGVDSGTRPGKLAAEEFAATKEANLDGTFRETEGACGRRNVLLVKVGEQDGVAVFGGKSEDGTAEGFVAGRLIESCPSDDWIGRLGNFVEREHGGGDAAEFSAVEIGGESKEPGGEGGVAAELGEIAPSAEEGFLGHFFGAGAIAAKAPRKIDERRLPAADDGLESGGIAGKDAGDDGFVGEMGLGLRSRGQIALLLVRPGTMVRGFIIYVEDIREQF